MIRMIPPVEERSIRPCRDCISSNWEDTSCSMFDLDYTDFCRPNNQPCKYHITPEEYRELIDSL